MASGNTPRKEDYGVVIGRFQPPHKGHIKLLKQARDNHRAVIVVLGSAHQSRDTRNPWTWQERAHMIALALGYAHTSAAEQDGFFITPVADIPYNETAWVRSVQLAVSGIVALRSLSPKDTRIRLYGQHKDVTSYYLNLFPNWTFTEVNQVPGLDATSIRDNYFDALLYGKDKEYTHADLSPDVSTYLQNYADKPTFKVLAKEWQDLYRYREAYANTPFPPVFVTVDAVVTHGGHILLVTRGGSPGKGLLALPGGFLQQDELIVDGMIRELVEETGLKLPIKVIKGSINDSEVYDHPRRSQRGRTISHAYWVHFEGDGTGLPAVRGSDDASHAAWYPLGSVVPSSLFEDHYHIIQDLIGL